jgi:hypothetical protein
MKTLKSAIVAASLLLGMAAMAAEYSDYSGLDMRIITVPVLAEQKIIISCPLVNPEGNSIGVLAPEAGDGDKLSKWTPSGWDTSLFSVFDGAWSNPDMTLNPGEAAFYQNMNSSETEYVSFVGVPPAAGNYTNNLPRGEKVGVAPMVPVSGLITTDLGVQPDDGDECWFYNPEQDGSQYVGYAYSNDDGGWISYQNGGQLSEPTLHWGVGCFYIKATNAVPAHTNWVMNYSP